MTRKLSTPFAVNSTLINQVPVSSTDDTQASYDIGFPPKNFQPISNGGVAVDGKDFNGLFNDITGNIVDLNKGLPQYFDSAYSTLIGGYPLGSRLMLDDNSGYVVSTIASNVNNPNTSSSGWTSANLIGYFSDLTSLRDSNLTYKLVFLDNYTLSDGRVMLCGGLFKLLTGDTTSADNTALIVVTSGGARYKRILPTNGEYQIDWWFEPATDQDDFGLTLNRCAQYTKSANDDDTVVISAPSGLTFIGSGGIRYSKQAVTLWANANDWDFKGTIIDFKQAPDDIKAIWLRQANNTRISNLKLQGKWEKGNIVVGSDGTVTVKDKSVGIYCHTNAPNINGTAVKSVVFDGIYPEGFCYPIRYGNNAYIHKWQNGFAKNYYAGLSAIDNPSNTGENISFDFFNITDGVMYMENWIDSKHRLCSFDYSGCNDSATAIALKDKPLFDGGILEMSECHFEWGNQYSIWYGSVFKTDVLKIKGGDLWLSTVDLNTINHPYFCEARDITKGIVQIDDFVATNTMFNGYNGSWGNGQKVVMKNIAPSTTSTMWRNFWKTDPRTYGNYINSVLPGMQTSTTSAGTADNALAYYKAKTRFAMTSSDSATNFVDFDATSNTLLARTTSTNTSNLMSLIFYAPTEAYSFVNGSVNFFGQTATTASNLNNPTFYLNIEEGVFDISGNFVKLQDLVYAPSAKDKDEYLRTSGISTDNRPYTSDKSTHVRVKIDIGKFYVTSGSMTFVVRCPRLEFVNIERLTNYRTV